MTSFAVSLLSGGLDSAIVTAYAKRQVDHITALTFNYGQKHDKEIRCAQNISKLMDLTHRIIDVPFFANSIKDSLIACSAPASIPQVG